jgi:hypothetical protein
MALIWQQLMSTPWLLKKRAAPMSIGGAVITHNDEQDVTLQQQGPGQAILRNVLYVNFFDFMSGTEKAECSALLKKTSETVTFSIEIAFNAAYHAAGAAPMSRLFVMIMDPKPRNANPCVGFRIDGNPSVYANPKIGPFGGAKGVTTPGGEALDPGTGGAGKFFVDFPADGLATKSTVFSLCYQMLVRPSKGWGSCYAPIDGGHLVTVDYTNQLTFPTGQAALGLYSDETTSKDEYRLNYIAVSMYKED